MRAAMFARIHVQALKILSDILPSDDPELDAVREDMATLFAQQHRHEGVVTMLGPVRAKRRPAFPDPAATLRRLAMLAAALSEMQRWRAAAEVTSRAVTEAARLWACFRNLGTVHQADSHCTLPRRKQAGPSPLLHGEPLQPPPTTPLRPLMPTHRSRAVVLLWLPAPAAASGRGAVPA